MRRLDPGYPEGMKPMLAAVALALALAGCEKPKKPLFEMCGADYQCASKLCFENVCSKPCQSDADCGQGRMCMDAEITTPGGRVLGMRKLCH